MEAEDIWKILFPTGQFDEAQVISVYAQEDMGLSNLLPVDVKIHSWTPSGQSAIKNVVTPITNAEKWLFLFTLYDTVSAQPAFSWTYRLWIFSVLIVTNVLLNLVLIFTSIFDTNYLRYLLISFCPVFLSGLQNLSHLRACRATFGCRPAKAQGSLMMKYLTHLHLYKRIPSTYLQCTSQVKQVGDWFLCLPLCPISFNS